MIPAFRGSGVYFGPTASDYATHRAGFPDGFYKRLSSYFGLLQKPTRILDIGAGTGTIARYLAANGHTVSALDPSPEMLDECRRLEQDLRPSCPKWHHPITYHAGVTAENTGIKESPSFDLVFAGQCWHWFDAPRALAEVKRLLDTNTTESRLIIAHFDWLLLPNTIGLWTSDLMSKYNPRWPEMIAFSSSGAGFYPQWTVPLYNAGFTDVESFSFIENVAYSHDAWCGRIRASAGIKASGMDEAQVQKFELELRAELDKHANPLQIPHRCFAFVCTPPRASGQELPH
jgi:SAM-dependent methyltransferase